MFRDVIRRRVSRARRGLLCAIAVAFCLGAFPVRAAGYLHASGTSIVDGSNQAVLLRGVNLGNWLFNESYMTGAPFDNDGWPAGLKDVLGTDANVAAFYSAWRSNYVTQSDIQRIKALGFNSVRVPFTYKLFYDDATAQLTTNGFQHFDNLLNWCAAAGLHAIFNLHGAPGGQRDPGTFFFDAAKLTIASNVWRRIAARYATHAWVGGYDLVSEPLIDTQAEKWRLRDAYVRLTTAIRQVDGNHLIFAEGNYYGADLYDLDPRWDGNMAFSIHNYWTPVPSTGGFGIATQVGLANAAGVPLWLGEFGENSNPWLNAERRSVEGYSVGWAVWPFKICGESIKTVEWMPFTAGYQAVLDYWNGTGAKPSSNAAYTALIDMAQRTSLAFCTGNKDFVDALLRTNFHTTNIAFTLNTAPGRIYAADFDMGNRAAAYTDAVFQTTAQGAGYTAWNNGWSYRNDGVDIAYTSDSGNHHYVGWIDSNEWVSFTLVATAGRPNLAVRYASPGGGRIHVEMDGRNITGPLALAATGGWTTWATTNVTVNTNLTHGLHTMKVLFETDGLNLYWLEFTGLPPLLPASWLDQDLGDPGRIGFGLLNASNGLWTVAGGGADIFGNSDQGRFVSRIFAGDGAIIARVASLQNTDQYAKGGVMFRDSSASNAPYACVFVAPNYVGFECRTNAGGAAFGVGYDAGHPPMWVKLARRGNSFSGYVSTNGLYWQQLGTAQTVAITTSARAGLAVTAHNNAALNVTTFDNVSLTPARTTSLITEGSSWRFNDSGADLGTAWRARNYDDSTWPAGPAQLGFGDGDEFTLVTSNRQVTTYFRRAFTVNDPGAFTNVILRVLRDDGAVVYLNANEVFRSNMPNGGINYLTLALTSVPSGDETTNFYTTNFSAALLVPGTNLLAVEIHQNSTTSGDLSFDLSQEAQLGRPRLTVARQGNSIVLAWPADFDDAEIQCATDLTTGAGWVQTTNAPVLTNGAWRVSLPFATNGQRFFRLQSP